MPRGVYPRKKKRKNVVLVRKIKEPDSVSANEAKLPQVKRNRPSWMNMYKDLEQQFQLLQRDNSRLKRELEEQKILVKYYREIPLAIHPAFKDDDGD